MSQNLCHSLVHAQPTTHKTHDECVVSCNESLVPLSESDSESESDVSRPCVGCNRRFVPTGPQRYCSRDCYSETLRRPIAHRFWSKVNTSGPVPSHQPHLGACWLWMLSKLDGFGHGQFTYRVERKQFHVYAHRYAWTLTFGEIPAGLQICHRCDNPLCVRPEHLFLCTQKDNITDARRKGRLVDGRHLIKVDDAGVRDIQQSYRPRHNGKQLAAKYGITLGSLIRIVKGTHRVAPKRGLERTA